MPNTSSEAAKGAGVKSAPAPGGKGKERRVFKPLPDLGDVNIPEFQVYFDHHIGEITGVQTLLHTKLSDSPAGLEVQLREAEAWYGRVTSIRSWADSYLDLAERRNLVPRDSDFTDVDREIHLAAACSRERRFRDVVKGLEKAIEQRVSVCQSLMKAFGIEKKHGV